jgi:plasmid maintenance system antidote protein VapI
MAIFDPERFGHYLENKFRESRYKSHTELATAAGLKRSTVSALIGAKPQTATNKPSQPKSDTVIRLAKALNADVDEFLLEAGHAPLNGTRPRPQTVAEFVRVLASMGFDIQLSAEDLQELTPDDLQDMIYQIEAGLAGRARRRKTQ